MHKSKSRFPTLFLLSFLLFTNLYGQSSDDAITKQIDTLFSNYNSKTPGVALVVVKDGKVIFKKAYGMANLEYDIPNTTKTVFQIASVSKQFTAFAAYLLEKEGKISLEDGILKYLPEMPDTWKNIRIKHLMSHTSGIRDQAGLSAISGKYGSDVTTTEHILRMMVRQKELNFEPGTQFMYSNTGYTLLAEIVKRASGLSLAEYSKKNIFIPLGMMDTQIYDDRERIVRNKADSYELEGSTYKRVSLNDSVEGPSNVLTTVEDMAKWILNFESPVAGDAELMKRFNEPSLLNNGQPVVWGITDGANVLHAKGQNNWSYKGLRMMSHGGHAGAFRSFLGRFPEKRMAVVALSNDEHYNNFDTSIKIAEFYLSELRQPSPVSPPVPNKAFVASNNNLKDYEGRFYNDELETYYSVRVSGGKMVLWHLRRGDIELKETGKDKFSGAIGFQSEIEFVRNNNGVVTGFKVSNFGAKNVRFDMVR